MKKMMTFIVLGLLVLAVAPVFAKSDYIYRNRANWVKVDTLSNKQLAGQQLQHPYTQVSNEQMVGMLQSLEMNKTKLFNKDLKESQIFSAAEARKFAPLIVKALSEVGPNQVVNMAVVHRRPYFVMRNDYISIINVFATDQGVHVNFAKLFAKLSGDYQQASNIDRSIRRAKSMRVNLNSVPGQVLVAGADEVILDPNYVFSTESSALVADTQNQVNLKPAKQAKVSHKSKKGVATVVQPEPTVIENTDIKTRLSTLESLKKEGLITASEYNVKRQAILKDL